MSDEVERVQVMSRLEAVLASETLSDAAKAQAKNLLDRLGSGVNVVVLGPKGAGKSRLCDVMLGHALPEPGQKASVYSFDDVQTDPDESVASLCLQCDFLKLTTVTDVTAPQDMDDFAATAAWAMSRADIVLWCTSEFGPTEANIWADASDHLKDHSFLVLTKADRLAGQGQLNHVISALQYIAAEEFHSFFPTSTLQAHATLTRTGGIPDDQMAASGIKALKDTLLRLAMSGRRADLDSALLFLERYGADTSAPETAKDEASSPQRQTYQKALDLLRSRTADISQDAAPDAVLNCCGALAEDLAELASAETQSAPDFDAWRNDLYEASDKVMLMTLENDLRSAADAATIILQLSRDLQSRVSH
ncbi:hypothetical protein ACOTTU_06480 [Roseobacter sp. EG26]|uniref:GTPase domain-containing protein n=1 Tax=Roseobacter sp. EG26 TaxID=3412477 RepID=UPI003CE56972